MSEQMNREVCVLAEFTDPEGVTHEPGEVFTVAYQTNRQRHRVNQMVFRGFLTFDLASAKDLRKS